MSLPDALFTADAASLHAAREQAFARTMDLVVERHPHTRDRLRDLGLARGDFQTLADLQKLPLTTKAEYMAAPERFILDTTGLPLEMRTVWDTMYTTGSTSGQPTPFVSTSYDFFNILAMQQNMLRLRGVTQHDLIANLFPLTPAPHGAWIRVLHAAASMNIPVVCAMPGNPSPYFTLGSDQDDVVALIGRTRATILWGVPSYIQRILLRAAESGAHWPAVRAVFVTGEALNDAARLQMQQALEALGAGAARISISYGSTEMQGGMVECQPGAGFHNPLPEQMLVEVVDPVTGTPLADGQHGAVVLTHLNRRGTVLLRYALGDTSILSRGACPACGVITDRLVQTPRRSDTLVKIKGMLVYPQALIDSLDQQLAATPYLVSVRSSDGHPALSADRLVLQVEGRESPDMAANLIALVKAACGVTPEIAFVTSGGLTPSGAGWKAKKFIDLRHA